MLGTSPEEFGVDVARYPTRQSAVALRARCFDKLEQFLLALRATRFSERVSTFQLGLLEQIDDTVSELYSAMVALDGWDSAAESAE